MTISYGDGIFAVGWGGYASRLNADFTDINYSHSFSIEMVIDVTPFIRGVRWGAAISKVYFPWGSSPGWNINYNQGWEQYYYTKIYSYVADNSIDIGVGYDNGAGTTHVISTFDTSSSTLSFYINGIFCDSSSNPSINPLQFKTTNDFGIGTPGYYYDGVRGTQKNVRLSRLWNRLLSASEAFSSSNYFFTTNRHDFPVGFNTASLLSNWDMLHLSNYDGTAGTSSIKDISGSNHLQLYTSGQLYLADGYLTASYPIDTSTNVSPTTALKASNGVSNLTNPTRPIQYQFQIDSNISFTSTDYQISNWDSLAIWYPQLKPNTTYYWQVRVKDSADNPISSSFTTAKSFTTRNVKNWFVRPFTGSTHPDGGGTLTPLDGYYGTQDGTSYTNAWNGITNVEWGNKPHPFNTSSLTGTIDGVSPGDTLYICDSHFIHDYTYGFIYNQGDTILKQSGISNYPITLRGDYTGSTQGIIYGYSGSISGTGFNFVLPNKLSYITFQNMYLSSSAIPEQRIFTTESAHHMSFIGGNYIGTSFTPTKGNDYWTWKGCEIGWNGDWGIYSFLVLAGNPNDDIGANNMLIDSCYIHDIGISGSGGDQHCIGVQGSSNCLFQYNRIERAGAMEFWTYSQPMRNNIIRYNYLKDIHAAGTGGEGIGISGDNVASVLGLRNGYKIYGNIIDTTGVYGAESWMGIGIACTQKDPADVYNNIVYNSLHISYDYVAIYDGNDEMKGYWSKNISVNPQSGSDTSYGKHFQFICSDTSSVLFGTASIDYNLYYPILTDFTGSDFNYSPSFPYPQRDSHSVVADPLFVNPNPSTIDDFRLQSNSPAWALGFQRIPIERIGKMFVNKSYSSKTISSRSITGSRTISIRYY